MTVRDVFMLLLLGVGLAGAAPSAVRVTICNVGPPGSWPLRPILLGETTARTLEPVDAGRCRTTTVAPGRLRVRGTGSVVTPSGLPAPDRSLKAGDPVRIALVRPEGCLVHVRLVDAADGEVLAGLVDLTRPSRPYAGSLSGRHDGAWIDHLPCGTTVEGWATAADAQGDPVPFRAVARPRGEVEVVEVARERRACPRAIRVVDPDGVPVEGAEVHVAGWRQPLGVTDEDGRATYSACPHATSLLRVTAAGYEDVLGADEGAGEESEVALGLPSEPAEEATDPRTTRVRVRVVDERGAAVPGAHVGLGVEDWTALDGSAEATVLADRPSWIVASTTNAWDALRLGRVRHDPGVGGPVVIVLSDATACEGPFDRRIGGVQVVFHVPYGTAFWDAGIRPGDVLTHLDEHPVGWDETLRHALPPGTSRRYGLMSRRDGPYDVDIRCPR